MAEHFFSFWFAECDWHGSNLAFPKARDNLMITRARLETEARCDFNEVGPFCPPITKVYPSSESRDKIRVVNS
jgi:hypothetical protein